MPRSDPGSPATRSDEPPRALVKLTRTLRDPQIMNVGLTKTPAGEWAVMIRVKPGTLAPLPGIGRHYQGFPVVYQEGSATLPVARPAFPAQERE